MKWLHLKRTTPTHLCALKEDDKGNEAYKARYVAKGYSQVEGLDYSETFSPTANLTSLRMLMQLAAQHDLTLNQMDVKAAYLHAPIYYIWNCSLLEPAPSGSRGTAAF